MQHQQSEEDKARAARFAAAAPVACVSERALAPDSQLLSERAKPKPKPPPAEKQVAPPKSAAAPKPAAALKPAAQPPPRPAAPMPAAAPPKPAAAPPPPPPDDEPPVAAAAPPAADPPRRRQLHNPRAFKNTIDAELGDPALPAPTAASKKVEEERPVRTYAVGNRVLARAPDADEDDGDEAEGGWVTGRVLGTRTHGGVAQYKVSLDGYDSENDEWMEGDDERLKPYEALSDSKDAAKKEAAEKEKARLQSEARRHDSRAAHEAAVSIS